MVVPRRSTRIVIIRIPSREDLVAPTASYRDLVAHVDPGIAALIERLQAEVRAERVAAPGQIAALDSNAAGEAVPTDRFADMPTGAPALPLKWRRR